ncbi:MAG TPA: hypothetical protein VGU03_10935 [Frateuria sp.]|uniref:hypothetical protein n=1 Tax=Frateuria sp. TaxID=2211372 RepID=UPI002DE55C22|nr:hypothetical protein [Frateuria sp.]
MGTVLKALLGALVNVLVGWWTNRQAARAQQRAADDQAFADTDTAAIREHASVAIEHARERTDAAMATAGAAADPVQLRDDVQAAVDRANAVDPVR